MLSRTKFGEIIGNNIKKARTAKGLTQDELAHKCSFYRTYINLLETNKRIPSSYNLHRISKALCVAISEIYPSDHE